jgi:NADH-quinone oxidoreductase subunit G
VKVLEEIADLPEFNGTVVYRCNPVNQFNGYTARTSQLEKEATLWFSTICRCCKNR